MADARELLAAYQERLRELRKQSGLAAPLLSPLQMMADVLDQALSRQGDIERQVNGILGQMAVAATMARDAPKTLRAQAQAFEAASVSFKQAADLMNLQADLLERPPAAATSPVELLQRMRPPQQPPSDD